MGDFTSDTRVILATSFPVFREIVLEYAKPKEANQWIFDQDQLDKVRLSPHHKFLWKDIAKIGVDILIIKKESLQLRIRLLQRGNIIRNTIAQIVEKRAIDPKKVSETEQKLAVQYQRSEDSLQTLNILLESSTHKLAGELDNLMVKHDQEWRNHRHEFTEKLIAALEKNDLIFEYEKDRLLKEEAITEILKEYEVAGYPLPIIIEKIPEDSGNYFLLQGLLTSIKTSFHNMQTAAPEQIYSKANAALKTFFQEEKSAAGKLIGGQEKNREKLSKEKNDASETLRQIWAQDASQYQDLKDLLDFISSTVGVNIKLKQAEQEALERALDEEFNYERDMQEGLRYD